MEDLDRTEVTEEQTDLSWRRLADLPIA